MINSKSSAVQRREMRGVVRAEMFGQLTSGLESAWNKLKGEGFPLIPCFTDFDRATIPISTCSSAGLVPSSTTNHSRIHNYDQENRLKYEMHNMRSSRVVRLLFSFL